MKKSTKTNSKKSNTVKVSAPIPNVLTWIVFIIDRSGSMQSIKSDMIGGFNSFIKNQQAANVGDCKVFAYQFDDVYESIFEGSDISAVPELTDKTYVPRGWTALYDAIGKTINHISSLITTLTEKPSRVLFVTITDGLNNASKEFDLAGVKKLIEEKSKDNCDFVYIGANQDAWQVGGSMGVANASSLTYQATGQGTAYMFDKLSKSTVAYRSCAGGTNASFTFQPDDEDDDKTP